MISKLNSLIWLHLHEHASGRELLPVLDQDSFARDHIAPPEGSVQPDKVELAISETVSNLISYAPAKYLT